MSMLYPGAVEKVKVAVKNNGSEVIPAPFTVELGTYKDERCLRELFRPHTWRQLADLVPGEMVTYEVLFGIPVTMPVGTHVYFLVVVDSLRGVEEVFENNNRITAVREIMPPLRALPDLMVKITSLPEDIKFGAGFTFGFSVTNIGPAASPATELSSSVRHLDTKRNYRPWFRLDIPALAVGETYDGTRLLDFPTKLPFGAYSLVLEIDPSDAILELDEGNNDAKKLFVPDE